MDTTIGIRHLAIGAEFTFSSGRFGILAKRVDNQLWTLTILTSDMEESDNMAQVMPNGDSTFKVHVDFDNGESFTTPKAHHGVHSALVSAVTILTVG